MEKVEIENKIEKAPKVVKKTKDDLHKKPMIFCIRCW